ncbi:uncharacterized protein LDX57_008558 [Aspergillus melleus]|uniref:uncharacterized protein n=1 Tax=Aspergillus melleus TaxID=138277 RepID=UPI001E8DF546|nr:uncharacterized protein LDX57_008558 [Aspergillus melleus]KAH8430894.1 hypothetical protein LDX57_008558 [Aspergillus melleus]
MMSTFLLVVGPLLLSTLRISFPQEVLRSLFTKPQADRPEVVLLQGTIRGTSVDDGAFPEPIEGFCNIPYALPPLGPLRIVYFRAQLVTLPDGPDLESEDCLTINVFRPKGHTDGDAKLPVAVLVPGGAFNRGAARIHNTASMLAWSAEPFVGVSFNYRIGTPGFLNVPLTAREDLLNLGLKDHILAFEWVRDNVARFGGQPSPFPDCRLRRIRSDTTS